MKPHHRRAPPLPWVVRFGASIRPGGTILDVACGSGRHVLHFLERGFRVVATDIDLTGIEDLKGSPRLEIEEADLEGGPWPFEGRTFDGVVVTNYLHRPLFRRLLDAVGREGVLIYATFAQGHEAFGPPRNADHLLRAGELLDAFGDELDVVAFEQGMTDGPQQSVVQRLCAVRPRENKIWWSIPP